MADYSLIEGALQRGYSMDEIADTLVSKQGMDPAEIRSRGYSSVEMLGRLGYSAPEPGFISGLIGQVAHGAKVAAQSVASAPGIYGGNPDAERIAETIRLEQNNKKPKEMQEAESAFGEVTKRQNDFESLYGKDTGFMDSVGKALDSLVTVGKQIVGNPKGAAYEMASQAGNMAAPMVGAYAGGKVGAVGGTLVAPGAGTAAGAAGGAAIGAFAGSHVMEQTGEFRGKVAERLSQLGLDPSVENVSAILQDKEWLDKTLTETRNKATGTAAVDAVLAAVGGKVLAAPMQAAAKTARAELGAAATAEKIAERASEILSKQSAWQHVAPHLKAGAIGWGGEPISEAAGQQVGYGHIDYGDVGMEALAGFGESVGTVYSAGAAMRDSAKAKSSPVVPSPSIAAAPTTDDAIKAFESEVGTASTAPRGSFSGMDDLAGLIESERSDLGKRRGLLAQQQQDARDMVAEFSGLVKDEQIDQSYRLNDAQKQRDAERAREGGYDLALQQREEQQGRTVEQLAAASEAQGFGAEEPTAMQLAMQQAQQKALDNEFSGLLKQERASLNEMRANVKRVAGVPVEQISTPQLEEIAQSEAHPNTKMAAVAALNDRHDAIQQERERLMQLRETRLEKQSNQPEQGAQHGAESHGTDGQVATPSVAGGGANVSGGGFDAAMVAADRGMRETASAGAAVSSGGQVGAVPVAKQPTNVRALTENAAKRQATQLTNQGYPTVAYPHPTQAGMWAIGSQDEAKAATVPATSATQNDAPPRQSASWVIRNKETGEVVMETFDRKKVDALNTAKYEAVPIREYLEGLNNRNESTAAEPPAVEVRAPVQRKRPASNNIAQAIINLGGISTSLKTDILGDASIKTRPGLFTTNGTGDLGEIAAMLSSEFGFSQIDLNDPTDNSGAKQLADLIASSVNGETILNEEAMIRAQQDEEFEQAKAEVNLQAQEIGIKPIRGKRTIDIVQSEINAILAEREEMSRQKKKAQLLLDEVAEQELIEAFDLAMQEYHDETAISRDESRVESARISTEESAQGDGDSVDQASPVAGRASPTEGGRGEAEVTPEFGLVGQTEAEARAEQGRLNQPEGLTKEQIDREATAPFSLHSDVMPPAEGPTGRTESMFTPDGRATKAAGDKPAEAVERPAREFIGTGDKLYSESGRALSPAPKIETGSARKTNASIKRMNAWLLDEARKEAEANGNDWQQTLLRGIDANKMQQPDLDTVNDILFGDPDGPQAKHRAPHDGSVETPKAAQSILKPLSEPTPLHPDRTSTIAAVRRGDLTPEDVAEAHPVEQENGKDSFTLERLNRDDNKTPYTIAEHSETIDKLNAGTLTVEEYKAAFARAIESREALAAEFQKMTKDAIMKTARLSGHYKNDTKDRIVKAAANETVEAFDIRESSTWVMGTDRFASLRNFVEGVTQADLDAYAAKRKAKIEEYVAGRQAMREGIDNPQTLEDFRNAVQMHKHDGKTFAEARMMLTPEQRATFDELTAEESRKTRNYRADQKAVVQVAAATTEGQIVQTKHTKTGEDLFVVKAAERVERDVYNQWNATAKKLGGWYSSFRGAGAVPGFQFKTMENAEAFLKYLGGDVSEAKAAVQERRDAFADDKSQSAVERLREMAERLDEKADEALGRDRKANTARRARFAAAAESAANGDKAMAATMRNIAQAIESGSAKFLDRVRQKTQIEMLNSLVSTAQWDYWRAKYPTYSEQERHKGEPAVPEVADYARFPQYTAFRSDLAKLGRQMLEIDGAKKIGQQLLSVADDVTDAYLEFAKANLHKVSTFKRGDGQMAAFSSRDAAEKAIARSGYKGKAIVLPFKRGQNIIVQSPSFAKENGIWEGDGDKLITLNAEVGSAIVAKGKELGRKLDVPSSFGYVAEKQSRLRAMGIETPAEFRAMLREFIGMKQAPKAPDRVKELERAMAGKRNTDGLDFFPTPAGTVRAMLDAAEIEPGMSVLEPSAGMGHIADMIREEGVEPDVVEISGERRELLDAKGHNVVGSDFMEVAGEYDRILMNPPFGDRRDAEHVRHAFDLLASNGRLVAIMGEGVFFGQDKKAQQFREWLESVGGTSEKLDEGTFLDPSLPVNTGVNARLVVIDKRSSDVAMFNAKSGSIGNPIDAAALESTIASVIAASPSQWRRDTVVTATLFADLPAPIVEKAKAEGYDAHGRNRDGQKLTGATYDGKVYLVQENISSEIEAEETLLHERIHQILHGNAEDENGKALRQSLGRLYSRIGGKDAIVALAKRIGADMSGPLAALPKVAVRNRPAFLVDEFLAHVEGQRAYEKFPQSVVRAIREFYGEFRDWLRSSKFVKIADAVGVNIGTFTQSDLSWTLKKIRQQQAGTGSKAIRFMTAWHGSPHDHDGFDSFKIGTGEGAQAYGWGHYFAEAREVAEWYRNTLSKPKTKATIDGKDFEDIDWLRNSGIEERWFNNWVAHPIASGIEDDMMVGDRINRLAERADQDGNTTKAKAVRKLLKMFNDGKIEAKIEKGRLYQVELAPAEDEYLDWDKPLSEQGEKIKAALRMEIDGRFEEGFFDSYAEAGNDYRDLKDNLFADLSEKDVSILMHSIGIRGIKYLDGSSRPSIWKYDVDVFGSSGSLLKQHRVRTKAEADDIVADAEASGRAAKVKQIQQPDDQNHNYVIFDDADVKITAKESRRASNDLDFTQSQGSEPLRKTSFGYANDTHNLFHVSTFKGNDGDVSTFDVYDTNTGEQLGFVSLGLRDGQITTLVAIEAEQKNVGFGEQLLRSLVASNPDGIYIINMLPEAVPFWQKMGVSLDEHFEGVWEHGNGVLTEEAIQEARDGKRGLAAEDPGGRQKESRGNAESESGRQANNPVSSKGVADKTAPANAGVSVSAPSESVRRIQAVVERFKSQFKGTSALDIRVVSTTFDIPARFRPSPFAEGVFHDDAGLVYLVTMNLHNPRGELSENRAWQVLLHESVGHYGLSQMMGDKFASILKAVKQATLAGRKVSETQSNPLQPGDKDYTTWEAVKLRYPDATDAELAQEVLARMSETDPGSSVLGYAVAVVRQWVRDVARAMGIDLAVSTSELRDLVAKASGYMRRGDNLAEEHEPSGLVAASTGVAREGGKRGLESRAATVQPQGPIWSAPEMSRTDNIIYTMQDKNIDLKRVQQAIKSTAGEIRDDIDAYLQEELFHGRAAKITEEFLDKEVNPLISLMRASNVSMDELETFLWARHAKERNAQIAKINDEMPDGGSGLTNKQADDLMGGKDVTIGDKTIAGVKPARKKLLSDLAGRVDVITKGSRALLERYGLESAETLNAWDGAYQHYVPLHREDTDSHLAGMGTGQGYSVKGSSSKRATGSFRPVENILANLVLQRERIITRGEKNRVAQALHGLAKEMPNADLWEVDVKPTIRTTAMIGGREQVVDAVDPNFRNKPNVVFARFNGEDRFVVFNEHNERALRMAEALKNLDADDISHLLGEVSRWTRYFASINTQYNPIFGVTNLVRDVQTGLLNLKSTPLDGKQKEMAGNLVHALPAVFKALRADRKGQAATGTWAQLWEEFQEVGGQTGYRDMFRNSHERAEALQNALDPTWWQKTWWGKAATVGGIFAAPEQVFVEKVGKPFMELLSDYNTMMENGIRLSAYKLALDSGMTKERAASLAKNLTVNFNRKGQAGRQVGAMYAFFNASVQGTARMAETLNHGAKPGELLGKAGKQIIYGGLMLGALQAMLLLAAGFDDEEPPEFVRDRNIIIPTGNGKYISIPLPLGFHVLPAISRISIEFTAGGFKKPGEHLVHIMDVLLDSFNPIGNAGLSMQTVAPTVLDPIAALTENKDWSGRQIARQDFSKLNPTPGHTRAKDTASSLSRGLAYALNYLSGGGEYGIGVVSPTPDQIDYLLGQLTGGVGRELGKVLTTAEVLTTGEDLPPHKIPLVGRFYGDTTGQSSEASKFYGTLEKLSEHKGALDRMKDAHDVEAYREYAKEHPEIRLYARAARVQREMASLRKLKRKMIERNADRAKVRQIEDRMRTLMTRFNQSVSEQKGDH